MELFAELSSVHQEMVRGGDAASPGFQIGGKSTTYEQWLGQLEQNLGKSSAPSVNPGKSQKVGGNGIYPGGLNSATYQSLLDRNPNFYTPVN